MSAITDHGPFRCVEEVVRLFKISRTKAYKEAQLYIETAGKAGIPAVRIGRSIRFLSEPIQRMAAAESRHERPPLHGRRTPAERRTCTR
jgi:hypothetical protein